MEGNLAPILEHLLGFKTIGFYQIYKNKVKWICFDIDDHSDESKGEKERTADDVIRDVFALFAVLNKYKVPFLFEASGSPNSYHIWVFLKPTRTLNAYMFAQQIAYEANFKGEVFPKQDYLPDNPNDTNKKTLGNLVKSPLGVNRKSGVRSQFLDPDVYNPITRTFLPLKGDIPIPMLVELLEVSNDEANISVASQHHHRQTKRRIDSVLDLSTIPAWDGADLTLRPCMKGIVENHTSLDKVGGGHAMHLAIAIEATLGGMSLKDKVNLFRPQPDFDEAYTIERLTEVEKNLKHSYRCNTLQDQCASLVEPYCKKCYLNPDYIDASQALSCISQGS